MSNLKHDALLDRLRVEMNSRVSDFLNALADREMSDELVLVGQRMQALGADILSAECGPVKAAEETYRLADRIVADIAENGQ